MSDTSEMTLERCDPRERADEIIALFDRDGHPEFREVFERTYRPGAENGLRSWIGVQDGRVVMHVSVTPLRFTGAGTATLTGVMGDLMVDESVRGFWGPLKLLRRVCADVKQDGEIAALLTTTTPEAKGLFTGAGFKPAASFRRFVLPVAGPWRFVFRVLNLALPRRVVTASLGDVDGAPALPGSRSGAAWRPEPDPQYYSTRIPRHGFADGTWISVAGVPEGWVLLSRHQDWPEFGVADGFWREGGRSFAELFLGAAAWARKQGAKAISVTTIDESVVARRLRRVGFVGRDDHWPYYVNVLLGDQPLPPPGEWFLTGLIASRW